MSENSQLHQRLDELSNRLSQTRAHLEEKKLWNSGHHLTAGQLEARYVFLKKQIDHEAQDAEAHGRHVSDLERSVREWIGGLEIEG
ncbi:MAG: 3-ketoacyl-ACP reductase [Roseobacter sp.]|uniref:hypothetical protein n=1 Tax=Alphaproteobacteria TaxID=28211 RepID=UPI003265C634